MSDLQWDIVVFLFSCNIWDMGCTFGYKLDYVMFLHLSFYQETKNYCLFSEMFVKLRARQMENRLADFVVSRFICTYWTAKSQLHIHKETKQVWKSDLKRNSLVFRDIDLHAAVFGKLMLLLCVYCKYKCRGRACSTRTEHRNQEATLAWSHTSWQATKINWTSERCDFVQPRLCALISDATWILPWKRLKEESFAEYKVHMRADDCL